MGETYFVKCPYCNEEFYWRMGHYMLGGCVSHCDSCGKSKEIIISDEMDDVITKCECGGTFYEGPPIKCPCCKHDLSDSDFEDNSFLETLWD